MVKRVKVPSEAEKNNGKGEWEHVRKTINEYCAFVENHNQESAGSSAQIESDFQISKDVRNIVESMVNNVCESEQTGHKSGITPATAKEEVVETNQEYDWSPAMEIDFLLVSNSDHNNNDDTRNEPEPEVEQEIEEMEQQNFELEISNNFNGNEYENNHEPISVCPELEVGEEQEDTVSSLHAEIESLRQELAKTLESQKTLEMEKEDLIIKNENIKGEREFSKQIIYDAGMEMQQLKKELGAEKAEKEKTKKEYQDFRSSVKVLQKEFLELNKDIQEHFQDCCNNSKKVAKVKPTETKELEMKLERIELFTQGQFQVWESEQLIMQERLEVVKDDIKKLQQDMKNQMAAKMKQESCEANLAIVSVSSLPFEPTFENENPAIPLVERVEIKSESGYLCGKCGNYYLDQNILHQHEINVHASPEGSGPKIPEIVHLDSSESKSPPTKKRRRKSKPPSPSSPPVYDFSDSDDEVLFLEETCKAVEPTPKPVMKIMSSVAMAFVVPASGPSQIIPLNTTPQHVSNKPEEMSIIPIKEVKKARQVSFTGKRHTRNITKRHRGFYCICGIKFISRKRLDGHLDFHNVVKKSLPSQNITGSVVKIKQEKFDNALKKKQCERKIIRKPNRHQHKEDPSKELHCICGKWWPRKFGLKQHIHYYKAERKFPCELCPKLCVTKGFLKLHYRNNHKLKINGDGTKTLTAAKAILTKKQESVVKKPRRTKMLPQTCEVCDKTFQNFYHLYGHMQNVHKMKLDKRKFYDYYRSHPRHSRKTDKGESLERTAKRKRDPKANRSLSLASIAKMMNENPSAANDLQKHKVDKKKEPKGTVCVCGLTFSTEMKLRGHLIRKGKEKKVEEANAVKDKEKVSQQFACMTCGEIFTTNVERIKHRVRAHGHGLSTRL